MSDSAKMVRGAASSKTGRPPKPGYRENNRHRRDQATKDEIEFIKGIGTHGKLELLPDSNYLLERYREACLNRVEWGSINREAILEYLGLPHGMNQASKHQEEPYTGPGNQDNKDYVGEH